MVRQQPNLYGQTAMNVPVIPSKYQKRQKRQTKRTKGTKRQRQRRKQIQQVKQITSMSDGDSDYDPKKPSQTWNRHGYLLTFQTNVKC